MRVLMVLLPLVFMNLVACKSYESDRLNNKSAKKLVKKKNFEAYEGFLAALSHAPYNPLYRLNLSLSQAAREDLDKSIQELRLMERWLEKNPSHYPPEVQFEIFYNLGTLLGLNQQVEPALDIYQRALKLRPGDAKIRNNIEVFLTQQSQSGKSDKSGEGKEGEKGSESENQQGKGDEDKEQDGEVPEGAPEKGETTNGKPQDLTEEEMEQIIEEIENQEQKVRGKIDRQSPKEAPNGKAW